MLLKITYFELEENFKRILTGFRLYSGFHRFTQGKFDNDGSIISSSQVFNFCSGPAASKNEACFKSGQNQLRIIGSLATKLTVSRQFNVAIRER